MKVFKHSIMPLLFVVALFSIGCTDKAISKQKNEHATALVERTTPANEITRLSGRTMGTYWKVTIAQPLGRITKDEVQNHIEQVLAYVNKEMSTYDPSSSLSLFNKHQELTPYKISPAFMKNIVTAMKISRMSKGYYDITVAPLVNLWGFGPKKIVREPTEEEISTALQRVGYQNVQVNEKDGTIAKKIPNLEIDLSSIAKGYGVDAVSDILKRLGYHHFLVDIGGELIAHGNKLGQPWMIAIEKPENTQSVQVLLPFRHSDNEQTAMATSGNYRNFIDYDGHRAVHTINPHTGKTAQSNLLSVTVIQDNCMLADGYATALMALGADKAETFANENALPVLFIFGTQDAAHPFRVAYSNAWQQKFMKEGK